MSFYDYIAAVDIRTVNMARMTKRFGVERALNELPAAVRVQALARCWSCGRQEACRAWLDAGVEPDAPPTYCRNSPLIDDLGVSGA